jgi:imidazole glycerol-phosphate synthase subunit HisH
MLTIVDIDSSNIGSVVNAIQHIGHDVTVTDQPDEIEKANIILLPGVGTFRRGMEKLRSKGLIESIQNHVKIRKKPLIGICLGMQLLAGTGDEQGATDGLGLIPGHVKKIVPAVAGYRVPNVGWHQLQLKENIENFVSPSESSYFYFLHSFQFVCQNLTNVIATINYGGIEIAAIVKHENVWGVQFHPEKSQNSGLDLLHELLSSFAKSR